MIFLLADRPEQPAGEGGDVMTRLIDRMLARVAQKETVDAGCSRYEYCKNGIKYLRMCCLNEGCSTSAIGRC